MQQASTCKPINKYMPETANMGVYNISRVVREREIDQMAKFNVVQKRRRARIAESKREKHGDPLTKKLKNKTQPLSISGKRKRKLLKKWRREQKAAVDAGLVTMQDVEMAFTPEEGTSRDGKRTPVKFHMKKGKKLKQLKRKGRNKSKAKPAPEVSVDAMVE